MTLTILVLKSNHSQAKIKLSEQAPRKLIELVVPTGKLNTYTYLAAVRVWKFMVQKNLLMESH